MMAAITILLSSSVSLEESWEICTYSLQLLHHKTEDGKGWSLVLTVDGNCKCLMKTIGRGGASVIEGLEGCVWELI